MKILLITFFLAIFTSCEEAQETLSSSEVNDECRGEWSEDTSSGLKKFNEFYQKGLGCVTEQVALSQWEKSFEKRSNDDVQCTPQVDLGTMWLRSSNNFYTYKNNRIYLELDASTGEARRLIIAELENGKPVITREKFCYYLRTDGEIESVNPQDYGAMILFDLEFASSSSSFHPMEIYNYSEVGDDLFLTKMDNNSGVDWTFCSTNSTPWGFCDELRNGNSMYYPEDPNATVQAQLKAEAILIRSQMNFIKITEEEFYSKWSYSIENYVEVGTSKYISNGGKTKYLVNSLFDEPFFVGRAWRDYIRGDRPQMPDVQWAATLQTPYVCYQGQKEIVLNNGSTSFIDGEICINQDGEYVFTED